MSDLVQMRWPDGLREAVDERAGPRGRTRFAVEAVKAALAQDREDGLPGAGSQLSRGAGVEVSDFAASPSEPLRANFGSLEGVRAVKSQVGPEGGLERRSFACGCVTRATSPKARCPTHNRGF